MLMEKVQATIELYLHLEQFQNLIPLENVYCQMRTSFEILTNLPHTVEGRIFHTKDGLASVKGNVFSTSIFEMVETTSAITIDDVVIYTINILLDTSKIEETLNALESRIVFDVCYAALNNPKDLVPFFSQDTTLHFNLHQGIHDHMNIMFKSFSKLSIEAHAMLVVLQPPLKCFYEKTSVVKRIPWIQRTKTKIQKLKSAIFGKTCKKKLSNVKCFVIKEKQLQHAYRFHSTLRSCLLLSYDGFCRYLTSISETLPSSFRLELEKLDIKARLSEFSDKVTEMEDLDDVAEAINASLIQLSAELLNLWGTFLQVSLENKLLQQKMKNENFKNLFFSTEHLRQEAVLYDEKTVQSHKRIYKKVKKALKVNGPLECLDENVILKSPPVIFEDRYLHPDAIDDYSEDVESSAFVYAKDIRRRLELICPIKITDTDHDLNTFFYKISSPLMHGLFKVKKVLRDQICMSLTGKYPTLDPKNLTLNMMLDDGSNEGISVHMRMRYMNEEQVIITFVYGYLGGRTTVIGQLENKHETLTKYNSLANRLLSQIAEMKQSKNLEISTIRLFHETSKKKLIWKQNIQTPKGFRKSTAPKEKSSSEYDGTHLIVCVHGMGGSEHDLQFLIPYIESGVTHGTINFLMSKYNMNGTSDNIGSLARGLLTEIVQHITMQKLVISRISFIGFSIGTVIIRATLCRPEFDAFLGNLHTFLSFGGPHMGLLYHTSCIVNMGMRYLQGSDSLSQLAFKDHRDPRQTFLYKLSQQTGLERFKNVVLVSSLKDYYVPYHSARIEMCKAAMKRNALGKVYREMLYNILEPVINNKNCNFVRYEVGFDLPISFQSVTGVLGHCSLIISSQFLENFFQNAGLKYFK